MADDPLAQAVAHKPCPWCGSTMKPEAKLTDGYKWGALSCAECSATAPEVRTSYLESPHWYADALVEWNKRPAEDATLAALHAAREDAARWRFVRDHGHLAQDSDMDDPQVQLAVWVGGHKWPPFLTAEEWDRIDDIVITHDPETITRAVDYEIAQVAGNAIANPRGTE